MEGDGGGSGRVVVGVVGVVVGVVVGSGGGIWYMGPGDGIKRRRERRGRGDEERKLGPGERDREGVPFCMVWCGGDVVDKR